MAYPPPPGVSVPGSSISHPSLPARPPPSKVSSGFKPAFAPVASAAPTAYSSAPSSYGAPPASRGGGSSYSSYAPAPMTAPGYQSQPQPYQQYPQAGGGYQQAAAYGAPPSSYSATPQIRNPFPAPGSGGGGSEPGFDPDMAAQIAQWQSAYAPRDSTRDATSTRPPAAGGAGLAAATIVADPTKTPAGGAAGAAADPAPGDRKKTVVREGGGKKWSDDTLVEWDPTHLRLFVGNLAGEVTDESLLKAFSRWKSVQKARVIRDKRSTKSKGYGFVSFSDADDFFQAAKEMNGKYIQSHPVIVTKAKTEIKVTNVKEKDRGKNYNKKKHGGGGKGGGGQYEASYEPNLGPTAGAGVTKPGQKTKNGLRLLG